MLSHSSLGPAQRILEGTVVAWCPSDSNDGDLVQIVFDDKSAPTALTIGEFNQCRAAYILAHPDNLSIDEEAKQRRENERRLTMERRETRGGGGRGERARGRGERSRRSAGRETAASTSAPDFPILEVTIAAVAEGLDSVF